MCFICVSRNLLVCYRVRGCVYDQYYVSSCMCQQMHNALLRCPSRTFAMNMALKKFVPRNRMLMDKTGMITFGQASVCIATVASENRLQGSGCASSFAFTCMLASAGLWLYLNRPLHCSTH